jgi:hypothetical protein
MRTPSEELTRWLWLMTPPGAPTVPVLESTGRDDGPGHVPLLWTAQTADLWQMDSRARIDAVRSRLPQGVAREPGTHRPRAGRGRWAIEAAYLRDVWGHSEAEIGERLELYDTDEAKTAGSDRCRQARTYVSSGRRTLASLGAWPWALDDEGRLERQWWTIERYAAALLVWHELSCVQAIEDALRATRGLITPPMWRSLADTWRPAHDLYRVQLAAALDAADSMAA